VTEVWPWALVAALGAYHGLNPAMGWLFAVALGMQERSRGAVLRALPPIALGHELAVGVVALLVLGLGAIADPGALRVGAGAALVLFGLFRFLKPRAHPRWTTLRVGRRELAWWSFLMASAHGAGLMVAPVLLGMEAGGGETHALAAAGSVSASGLALLLHVVAMVAVMGAVAVVVYEKVGLAVLRRGWINSEPLWAGAFVVAGAPTLFT